MVRKRSDPNERPEETVVLASGDTAERRALREFLTSVRGRAAGSHRLLRVVEASTGDEALRRTSASVSAVAVELSLRDRTGLEVVQELRGRRSDLAVLAFTSEAPAAHAVAAMMAGADAFHERRPADLEGFARALTLAIDRRRLQRVIDRNESEIAAARGKLARLSGDLARSLPGFRPPAVRDDVIPFGEAARRYLEAAARIHPGNAQQLAARLGVSYFALRRLLARYGVPFPRSRTHGTSARWHSRRRE